MVIRAASLSTDTFFEPNGKLKSEVWETYFECYTQIVWNSRGYQEIIRQASAALPESGWIADVGCGTGNFVVGLHDRHPGRKFVGIDLSERGLQIARDRARRHQIDFHDVRANLTRARLAELVGAREIRGCVLNNVLYTIRGHVAKMRLLRGICNLLPQGAILVLNDPDPCVAVPEEMDKFIASVDADVRGVDGVADLDLALFSEINRRGLSRAILESPESTEHLARKAGFDLVRRSRTYYGYCNLLVLRKQTPALLALRRPKLNQRKRSPRLPPRTSL